MNLPGHFIHGSVLAACLALVTGCASTSAHRSGAKKDCTRLEAAARAHLQGFAHDWSPVKIQKKMVADCKAGDLQACVAVPGAIPLTTLMGIFGAPFMIPAFMVSDTIHRNCGLRAQPDATSGSASASDSQRCGTGLTDPVVIAAGWAK